MKTNQLKQNSSVNNLRFQDSNDSDNEKGTFRVNSQKDTKILGKDLKVNLAQ